jgi:hypothetical protein
MYAHAAAEVREEAGGDHIQGAQELRADAQLAARHQVPCSLPLLLLSYSFALHLISVIMGGTRTGTLWEGSPHQLRWILNHQHLIQKRRCGLSFLLKVLSTLLLTSHAIFDGRTTALWFSGHHYLKKSIFTLPTSADFLSSSFLVKLICSCVHCSRTLRKLFNVDPADYMISLCGDDALRELSSPGKSGSFFYLTNDDKYMIKTMKKSEVKVCL